MIFVTKRRNPTGMVKWSYITLVMLTAFFINSCAKQQILQMNRSNGIAQTDRNPNKAQIDKHEQESTHTRVVLWSFYRNRCTTMMRAFGQRPDTVVFDEPFNIPYWRTLGYDPLQSMYGDVIRNDPNPLKNLITRDDIINKVYLADHQKPIAFFKELLHHFVDDEGKSWHPVFFKDMKHIIFIRNPEESLRSLAGHRSWVCEATGIKAYHLEHYMKDLFYFSQKLKNLGAPVIVVDSDEVLKDPPNVLKSLCAQLHIPFWEEMLHWEAGPRAEDGYWNGDWYKQIHSTTGFDKNIATHDKPPLPEVLKEICAENKEYYDILYQDSLKA